MNAGNIVIIIAVLALIVTVAYFVTKPVGQLTAKDIFAKCLSEKGAVMYGAEWCPHCKDQIALFGESFRYINYVECPQNPELCRQNGIEGYPTWIINGRKYVGKQSLSQLSRATGCQLPV